MLDAAEVILGFATIVVFVLSVIAALAARPKFLELACHFRVQYFVAAVALGVVCVALAEWIGAAMSLVSAVLHLPVMASSWKAPHRIERNGRRFKLMLMNVDRLNRRYSLCVDCVRKHQPDVVFVQELNDQGVEEFGCLQEEYPFTDVRPMSDGSGIALYSRLPFELMPLMLSEGEARPGILTRFWDGELTVLSIHPRAPIRPGHFELRNRMLSEGAAVMREATGSKICLGDLNTTMWSRYFKDFVQQSGLSSVREGFGVLPTWPTFMGPKWLMIPIDHCFVDDDIRVVSVTTGERIGSDHIPLIVELELPRERPRVNAR